jgi:Mce-associated membrane protein
MTPSQTGDADDKAEQPQGDSSAVRVRTDAASEQDVAGDDTIEPKVTELENSEHEADAAYSDQPDTAVCDNAQVDQPSPRSEPAKGKLRFRLPWTRSDSDDGARGRPQQPRVRSEAAAPAGDTEDRLEQGDQESAGAEPEEYPDEADSAELSELAKDKRRINWPQVVAYGVLPVLALLLAVGAGYFKWQDSFVRASQTARIESVAVAKDATIAMLSYKSETVEKDLEAAKSRLTGAFKDSYTQLTKDVVIPGAKRAHVSTTATVPAAASASATPNHAVVLLFVNQTAAVDKDPPADTESAVRVTLEKVGGRWLISGFDPV